MLIREVVLYYHTLKKRRETLVDKCVQTVKAHTPTEEEEKTEPTAETTEIPDLT